MAIRINVAVRTALATALRDQIDLGTGAGYVEIRTGSQPATPATAASGTLLATVTLADPSGTISNGVLTLSGLPKTDTAADNTGTAGWFRIYASDGTSVLDGSAGSSGTDMIIDNPALVAGQQFSIVATSTFTVPMG